MLRFQPPGTEMEFVLNGHGSQLDQDSTLGQAVGTQRIGVGGVGADSRYFYGQAGPLKYTERDALQEFLALCNRDPGPNSCRNPYAAAQLAKRIATRPLDRRPYRGDYDRVGNDVRDTYGAFASGQLPLFDDVQL